MEIWHQHGRLTVGRSPSCEPETHSVGGRGRAEGKGADSVHAGIKHVQGLPISYTRSSANLHATYSNGCVSKVVE